MGGHMNQQRRRVVVTGLGAITPLGNSVEAFWHDLLAGKSGIAPVTKFNSEGYPVRIAAEVKGFEPDAYIERKDSIRMDEFAQYAVAAGLQAVQDARLGKEMYARDRVGVVIGTGLGGLRNLFEGKAVLETRGPAKGSPYFLPSVLPNMATGWLSILLGAQGPSSCVATACAAGAHAIADAATAIRLGHADCMIAGGAEATILPIAFAGFAALRALSSRNDEPERASRPFDRQRDGFVMGEGAGVVVLEEFEQAWARGAHIYAELSGYGVSSDAHHPTASLPDGEAAARAITLALADAGLDPGGIDYINAHGTSTPLNDVSETKAIKRAFGDAAYRLAVSSTKSQTGHLLGAAGAVEAIATVLVIENATIPATMNYEVPDPECDLDYVPNEARRRPVRAALSNAFAFGGTNVVLAFEAPKRRSVE